MKPIEAVELLSMFTKTLDRSLDTLGEVLATLRLNFERGHLTASTTDARQQFNKMLTKWEAELKSYQEATDSVPFDAPGPTPRADPAACDHFWVRGNERCVKCGRTRAEFLSKMLPNHCPHEYHPTTRRCVNCGESAASSSEHVYLEPKWTHKPPPTDGAIT